MWNDFEVKLINVVDSLVPMPKFTNDIIKDKPNPVIKRKLNLRNRLLNILKRTSPLS